MVLSMRASFSQRKELGTGTIIEYNFPAAYASNALPLGSPYWILITDSV